MKFGIFICALVSCFAAMAQSGELSLKQTIDLALKQNAGVQASRNELDAQRQLKKTSFDLPKTSASLLYGQYNGYPTNDNNITVTQTIPFSAFGSQGALNRSQIAASELKTASSENELVYQVKQVYQQIVYLRAMHTLLFQQDSIYNNFLQAASLRYKTGEAKLLELTSAETQSNEVRNELFQNESAILIARTQLKILMNSEVLPEIIDKEMLELSFDADTSALSANPFLAYMRQHIDVAGRQKKLELSKLAPDLLFGYFNQTLIDVVNSENGIVADSKTRFTGLQVGISIPLWFVPFQGRVTAAEFNRKAAENNYKNQQIVLSGQWQQAYQQYRKNKRSLEHYVTSALPNTDLILKQANVAFKSGDISYAEYLLTIGRAITIKERHLQTLHDLNQSIIYLEFLSGNK